MDFWGLTQFFRILLVTSNPGFCRDAILACCALHNFLQMKNVPYPDDLPEDVEEYDIGADIQNGVEGEELEHHLVRWCGVKY